MKALKAALSLASVLALVSGASSVYAATDWSVNLISACNTADTTSENCTSGGVSSLSKIYGYSTAADNINPIYTTFNPSTLGEYTGGIYVAGDGTHGTDNYKGIDALMLQFTDKVSLSKLTAGWIGEDNPANFSLLAYMPTGTQPAAANVTGKTLDNATTGIINSGWQLVGNYGFGAAPSTINVGNGYYSSYWLVTAYSSYFGGTDDGNICLKDQFKLLEVAGNTKSENETPEPGAMMLLGTGLLGMMALRRRRQTEN